MLPQGLKAREPFGGELAKSLVLRRLSSEERRALEEIRRRILEKLSARLAREGCCRP